MDILTALHTRRSIRAYTSDPVTDDEIHTLLEAAMIAPSAGNGQPWEFFVIQDKKLLHAIPTINPYAGMAAKAPVAIMVCGNLEAEKYPGFWVQDCSAATQNILLAGTALGLGTVWTAIYPMEDRVAAARDLFGLPQHIVPLSIVIIGRPAQGAKHMSRFDPSKVHQDRWNG